MSSEARILTEQEIDAARHKARVRVEELVTEVYGTDEALRALAGSDGGLRMELLHGKKTFARKLDVTADLCIRKCNSAQQISVEAFFDEINKIIAPIHFDHEGKPHQRWEDDIREYMAVSEQLLKALDLHKQFIEYNRSFKKEAAVNVSPS